MALSLSKSPSDYSDTELKYMMAQRLVEVADVIQAYVDKTVSTQRDMETLKSEMEELRKEMAEMRSNKPSIPVNSVDTFMWGTQSIVVKKDSGEESVRWLFGIKSNGNCLAWTAKSKNDPPQDNDLVEWTKDRWWLINGKNNEQGTKKK